MTPGPLTSTGIVPPVITSVFANVMLARGLPFLHYSRPARRKSMPSKSGTSMTFRRLAALQTKATPLVEGTPGTGKQLSKTDIVATLYQYGDYLTITDFFEMTVEDAVLADGARVLGEQAGQSIDIVFRNVVAAGTSVSYGGGAASRSALTGSSHKVDVPALRRLIRTLQNNNARPFTRLINAMDGYDSHPVREAYWAVTDPAVIFTLNDLPGWIPVANYASTDGMLPGEVGSFEELRFLSSTQSPVYTGATNSGATWDATSDIQNDGTYTDVHVIVAFGMDAFGIVPLDGNSFENIIHPSNSGGPTNPMNQYGTMAWKRTGAQVILNDNFMTRLEVAVANVNP